MSWVAAIGALILGAVLLKAIFDPGTEIYRCPYCNLVIKKYTSACPRCKRMIGWGV
ncbi:MAG: hypothetical protein R1F52_04505 [Candidatus Nitrosoabyssus spongiisocia]|nr:MAG: hypothetical protein R1F52_04505 [Nitrosopumilaceae archaeon AB1(1)]